MHMNIFFLSCKTVLDNFLVYEMYPHKHIFKLY